MQKRERADGEPASGRPKRAAAAAAAAAIAAGAPAPVRQKKGTPSPPDRKLAKTTRREEEMPQAAAAQALQESAGEQRERGQAQGPPPPLPAEQQHAEQHQEQQVLPKQHLPGEQQQQQRQRQPAVPPPVAPWVSPHRDAFAPSLEWGYQHLLPVAELRLRQAQRRRQQCQQLIASLMQTAQEVGMHLTVLQAAAAQAASGLPGMSPGPFIPVAPQPLGGAGGGKRAATGGGGGKSAATSGGGGSKHNPATCKVRNCLRCTAAARAQASMEGSMPISASAAAGVLPTPGSTPGGTPRVGQRRRRQGSPAQLPGAPALQGAPSASSGGSGMAPAVGPPAMSAEALMLWELHQQLDTLVCAAICEALPAQPAAQEAIAVWCEQSGCSTAAEVATVLDSSQQVWNMAVTATKDVGAKLLHWAAFLQACKRAAGLAT